MKNLLVLIFFLSFLGSSGQDIGTQLFNFIQDELKEGEQVFKLMKARVLTKKLEKKLVTDKYGKILNSNIDFENIEDESIIVLDSVGSVSLALNYTDSLLTIQPVGNSFGPFIRIDLNSKIAYLNDQKLNSIKKMTIVSENNGFESSWNGFRWKIKEAIPSISPTLTIGKLKKNDKLYLEIVWFENGKAIHYRLLT